MLPKLYYEGKVFAKFRSLVFVNCLPLKVFPFKLMMSFNIKNLADV